MLELAILGLLKEQDLHGYELKKRVGELLGPLSTVSFGSLYPALNRLESSGAVKAVEARDLPHTPMTGSLGAELAAFKSRRPITRTGRSRKVYGITERGQELFEELLAGDRLADDDRAFVLRLSFARYLGADARLALLERRRAALVDRLAKARKATTARGGRLDDYARSLAEHTGDSIERDIAWLDTLLEGERRASGRPA